MHTTIRKGMIYAILIIPFILNDFANIYAASYERWVLIDYACRLAALAFLGVLVARGGLSPADLSVSFAGKDRLACWTLFLAAAVIVYCWLSRVFLAPLADVWKVSAVAYDRQSALFLLDMTFGLALVAVSEELLFRGLALSALSRLTDNALAILVASSLVFALIHWSTGLKNILDSFAYGMLFMAVTMRTKSIVPSTLVHFALNYALLA